MPSFSFETKAKAHNIEDQQISRTKDVFLEKHLDFSGLFLSPNILKGLEKAGFRKPSPIQFKAIPIGLCGFDLIIKAKSGTGKTCVFSVIALEKLLASSSTIQTLVLAPTREIAVQIKDALTEIGQEIPALRVECFIGGMPIREDMKKASNCNIAVGAPGRVNHLIENGILDVSQVSLLVLDEADKLMEDAFTNDIKNILSNLPSTKQVILSSATLSQRMDKFIKTHMRQPVSVTPKLNDTLVLLGLKQFVIPVNFHLNAQVQVKNKIEQLTSILKSISFKQCIVFCNYQSRAESMCYHLTRAGWPARWISGSQDQEDRLETINCLKEFRCRVLLTTDLTARGIDAENINLVINFDIPRSGAIYLHRIGRAGRYGTYGLSISLVAAGNEMNQFRTMLGLIGGASIYVLQLPKEIPRKIWDMDETDFEKIYGIEPAINTKEDSDSIDEDSNNKKSKPEKFIQENLKIEMTRDRNISDLASNLLSKNNKSSIKILTYNDIKQLWENFNEKAISEPIANGNIAYFTLPSEFSMRINDELDSRIEIPYDIDISQIEQCLKSLVDGNPLPVREHKPKWANSLNIHSQRKNKEKEKNEERMEKNQLKKYGNEKNFRKNSKKTKKHKVKKEKEQEEEESENGNDQYAHEIEQNVYANHHSSSANGQSANANGQSAYANVQSANANGQSTYTNGQSANANGQSGYANVQSAYTNKQFAYIPTYGQSAYANVQSANANGQSAYTNEQSANANGQSAYTNEQSANANGQSAYTNEQSANANGQSAYSKRHHSVDASQSSIESRPKPYRFNCDHIYNVVPVDFDLWYQNYLDIKTHILSGYYLHYLNE